VADLAPALPWMSRRLDDFWDNDMVFRRHLLECRRITKQTQSPQTPSPLAVAMPTVSH
jgi:hypothetical protein